MNMQQKAAVDQINHLVSLAKMLSPVSWRQRVIDALAEEGMVLDKTRWTSSMADGAVHLFEAHGPAIALDGVWHTIKLAPKAPALKHNPIYPPASTGSKIDIGRLNPPAMEQHEEPLGIPAFLLDGESEAVYEDDLDFPDTLAGLLDSPDEYLARRAEWPAGQTIAVSKCPLCGATILCLFSPIFDAELGSGKFSVYSPSQDDIFASDWALVVAP